MKSAVSIGLMAAMSASSVALATTMITENDAYIVDGRTALLIEPEEYGGNLLSANDGFGQRVLNVATDGSVYLSLRNTSSSNRFVMQNEETGRLETSGKLEKVDGYSADFQFVTQVIRRYDPNTDAPKADRDPTGKLGVLTIRQFRELMWHSAPVRRSRADFVQRIARNVVADMSTETANIPDLGSIPDRTVFLEFDTQPSFGGPYGFTEGDGERLSATGSFSFSGRIDPSSCATPSGLIRISATLQTSKLEAGPAETKDVIDSFTINTLVSADFPDWNMEIPVSYVDWVSTVTSYEMVLSDFAAESTSGACTAGELVVGEGLLQTLTLSQQ